MKFNKFQRLDCAENNIARSYAETDYGWTNLLAIAAAAAACCHVMSDAIGCFTLVLAQSVIDKAKHKRRFKRIISSKFSESKSNSLPICNEICNRSARFIAACLCSYINFVKSMVGLNCGILARCHLVVGIEMLCFSPVVMPA